MAGWKKICCGIDFSARSRSALLEAAELTRRLGAELILVHVHEPHRVGPGEALVKAATLLEMAAQELHQKLDAWKKEAEAVAGRAVKAAVMSGAPDAELIRFAHANAIDAIVVGTHGRTGLSRVVLGSVAESVVRGAPCAVVVVRGQEGP